MKRSRSLITMMNGATKEERAFFRMMDNYDSFYGEYAACIRRYGKDMSDPDVITKMTKMINREAVMSRSISRLDQSSMTKAEHVYYMTVMDSIDSKLITTFSAVL